MFRTVRTVPLALAGAALMVAPGAAQAANTGSQKPVLITCGRGRIAQPRALALACADDGIVLQHLTWSAWGGAVAHATGTGYVNTCTPNCAAGTIVRYRVRVQAIRVMQTGGGRPPRYEFLTVSTIGIPPVWVRNVMRYRLTRFGPSLIG